MKKPVVHVTDHAVIRYLERVMGYDIESLRRQIGHQMSPAAELGACGLVRDGYRYVLLDRTLITVVKVGARPQATVAHRKPSR